VGCNRQVADGLITLGSNSNSRLVIRDCRTDADRSLTLLHRIPGSRSPLQGLVPWTAHWDTTLTQTTSIRHGEPGHGSEQRSAHPYSPQTPLLNGGKPEHLQVTFYRSCECVEAVGQMV